MAWTNPSDRVTGDVITAAQWNTFLGTTGDMSMTAAAKVTTNGDMVYATAANTLARLGIGSAGQTLQVSGGIPAWVTVAAATADVVLVGSSTTATTTTSTVAVDLVTISGLSILVGQNLRVEWSFRKLLGGYTCGFGLKLNSTQILTNAQLLTAPGVDDGSAYMGFATAATAADTGRGIGASQSSGVGGSTTFPQTSGRPQATITSVTITAINNTSSTSATVTSVRILTGIM